MFAIRLEGPECEIRIDLNRLWFETCVAFQREKNKTNQSLSCFINKKIERLEV